MEDALHYGKIAAKYAILFGYLLFTGSFAYTKYCKKKMKKI